MPKKTTPAKNKTKSSKKTTKTEARSMPVDEVLAKSREGLPSTAVLLPQPNAKVAPPVKKAPKAAATPTTNVAPTPPTETELQSILAYGVFTPAQLLHLLRAPTGYELIAKKTLADWQEIAADLKVPGLSIDTLAQALATRDVVAPLEAKIAPYFQRATENRRVADSEAMGVLLKLARAVKNAGDPNLTQRFQSLIDWISTWHTPKKPAAKKKTTTTTTSPTNGAGRA
jgi:hypothetical protein